MEAGVPGSSSVPGLFGVTFLGCTRAYPVRWGASEKQNKIRINLERAVLNLFLLRYEIKDLRELVGVCFVDSDRFVPMNRILIVIYRRGLRWYICVRLRSEGIRLRCGLIL